MVAGAALLFAASADARTTGNAPGASAPGGPSSASKGGGNTLDLSVICGTNCFPRHPVHVRFARVRRHCAEGEQASLYGDDRDWYEGSCLREESLTE